MSSGNIQIERGKSHDTGLIYIDLLGVPRTIFRSFVDFGGLPITTTKAVAHGILTIDPEYAQAHLVANDGTTGKKVEGFVDVTNVSVTTITDESLFTESIAVIDYIKA